MLSPKTRVHRKNFFDASTVYCSYNTGKTTSFQALGAYPRPLHRVSTSTFSRYSSLTSAAMSQKRNRLVAYYDGEDTDTSRPPKSPRLSSQPSSSSASRSFTQVPSSYMSTWQYDEPEIIDLTQPDEGPAPELYGTLDTKIVGVRYYNGVASPGEVVICKREPSNPVR